MKVLICGAGAIGIAIGCSLLHENVDVYFDARQKTKEALLEFGAIREGLFNRIFIPKQKIKIYDFLDYHNEVFDYVIISTKTTSNSNVGQLLNKNKNILGNNGKIVIFQNGWHTDKEFLKYFDKSRVYSARIITGFERPKRNISKITVHAQPILIGSLYNEPKECIEDLVKAINDSGIPCESTMEVSKALWAKMLYNCTLNPLGAILKVNYGALSEGPNSRFIMDNLIEEIFKVIRASGNSTYWDSADEYRKVFYSDLVPSTYNHRSSTLQDIERKIKTEIDTLSGSIVELGEKYNIDTPYNAMMYNLIKSIESGF